MTTDSDREARNDLAREMNRAMGELFAIERRKRIEATKARFRRRVEAIRQRVAAWMKWR